MIKRGMNPMETENNHPPDTSNITLLLRICTVLLAAVSFWSTTQGMREYTFANGWQAYAASLGIQGILLGLNFSLPHFLKQYSKWYKAIPLLLFSAFVMCCSSWFSFLFIAERGYADSWDTKQQLMAQGAYRDQLFAADGYVERYDEVLGRELTGQIQALYEMAENMDTGSFKINLPSWEEERETYIDNGGAAADEMATVITAMEEATAENVMQGVRQKALNILTAQQTSLQSNIDSYSEQIEEAQQQEGRNRTNLENAEGRLRNRPADVDPTPYQNAVDNASASWGRSNERLDTLQQEKQSYENALSRVNYYAGLLGMVEEEVDSYYIGTKLREIQEGLFQADPDLDQIRDTAIEIFKRLQSAEDLGTDNGAAYQEFMSLINGFIRNLEKRTQLKRSREELQRLAGELAAGELLFVEGGTDGWAEDWEKAFHELKFKISGLPVYNGDLSALPEEDFLLFDRSESTRALDRTIERYLTKHNAAEEGLIYLFSDYNMMAIFALVLAFLLDLAAFVTGIIIEREESNLLEKTRGRSDDDSRKTPVFLDEGERMQAKARCLNQYLFLTGDYTRQDGQYIYRIIEQGEEGQIDLEEPEKSIGLYLQKGKTLQNIWNFTSTAVNDTKLLYKVDTDGPADGIYMDCEISYEEGLLYIDRNGSKSFLGNVNSKMPVYKLTAQAYDMISAGELKKLHGQVIVIALDREGLQIVAAYIMLK